MKYEDNLIEITLKYCRQPLDEKKRDLPNRYHSVLRRRMKNLGLPQVLPDIKPTLNEQRRAHIDFDQEFKSCRAYFWGLDFFADVCFTISLANLIKSHLRKELPKKICLTGP